MSIKIGINGFGRIGRNVLKVIMKSDDLEVVAINDLTDAKTLAHLLKYDSSYGVYPGTVEAKESSIVVDGKEIPITAERNPADLKWGDFQTDIVLESTGIFTSQEQCQMHIDAGAKKVLLSVPPKGDVDALIVMGVNDDTLKDSDRVVSNASCTTNCLAPLAKVLHENFGIQRGLMNTIHAFTNDQRVQDMPHSDLRRARAASQSIIPTTTGAARAVGKVLPELNGKLDGIAMRVPIPVGSVVDLTAVLEKDASIDDINGVIQAAAEGPLKGILEYCVDPIVSADIVRNPHSSIFDSLMTNVMDGNYTKVISWYDNEWGYSNRCVDLFRKMA
ncbi:MAG: type I glyceraldehyde-3-phosphate dehydrogenase [Candidatus Hydrogenedentota bacterium]|nr:MAG: type I glyceraldehyde-3-phosphate dehydrogenase [Candidatus Hydrogenedentota bacterium]